MFTFSLFPRRPVLGYMHVIVLKSSVSRQKVSTRSRGWHISSQLLCGPSRRGSNLRVFPFPHHRYTCQFFRSNACFREKTESGRAVTHDWLNHPKRKRVSGWPYAISSVRCNLMFETEGNEEDSEDGRWPACSMPDSLFSALILFSFFSFHFRCPRARVYYHILP